MGETCEAIQTQASGSAVHIKSDTSDISPTRPRRRSVEGRRWAAALRRAGGCEFIGLILPDSLNAGSGALPRDYPPVLPRNGAHIMKADRAHSAIAVLTLLTLETAEASLCGYSSPSEVTRKMAPGNPSPRHAHRACARHVRG